MAMPRRKLVDPAVTRWYHCISKCVRNAFLLSERDGITNRKQWLQDRLAELCEVFAIAVAGFAILDNHLHLLARLDPEIAKGWSNEEVARRWGRLHPPRDSRRRPLPISKEWIREKAKDAEWIADRRERLQSLSWFMKCLKEGVLEGLTLPGYLLVVDEMARLKREGKAHLSSDLAPIFERLGVSAEQWQEGTMQLIEKLSTRKCTGRVLATRRESLQTAKERFGLRRLVNVSGACHLIGDRASGLENSGNSISG